MNLLNKTAVVTGASKGLGAAIASALVHEGVRVYGLARHLETLQKLQKKLPNGFISVQMDVSDQVAIEQWVTQTFASDETVDILVNNAGVAHFAKVDDLSVADWQQSVDINLNGVFYLTRLLVSLMKANPCLCYIVNVGSILGSIGQPEKSVYNATKFAIRGFSEALFKELRYDKIKVTCLNPGSIATDFFADADVEKHHNMLQPEDLATLVIQLLQTPDNLLVNELTVRPLNPKKP